MLENITKNRDKQADKRLLMIKRDKNICKMWAAVSGIIYMVCGYW